MLPQPLQAPLVRQVLPDLGPLMVLRFQLVQDCLVFQGFQAFRWVLELQLSLVDQAFQGFRRFRAFPDYQRLLGYR